jgi:hypothetical protein
VDDENAEPFQYFPVDCCWMPTEIFATPEGSAAVPQIPAGEHPAVQLGPLYERPAAGNVVVIVGATGFFAVDAVTTHPVSAKTSAKADATRKPRRRIALARRNTVTSLFLSTRTVMVRAPIDPEASASGAYR